MIIDENAIFFWAMKSFHSFQNPNKKLQKSFKDHISNNDAPISSSMFIPWVIVAIFTAVTYLSQKKCYFPLSLGQFKSLTRSLSDL